MMNDTATTAGSAATTSSVTTAGVEIAAGSERIVTGSAGTGTRRRAANISLRDGKSYVGLNWAGDGNTAVDEKVDVLGVNCHPRSYWLPVTCLCPKM